MNLLNQYQPSHLEHAGLSITYYDSGEAFVDSQRLPVVLVHGTTGTTHTHFAYLFPLLATRCRVISIDLSDVEKSQLQLEDFIEQVEAVIDAVLNGQDFTLFGYSLGAVVAAKLASQRTQQIQQLILLAGWQKTDTQQLLRNHIWTTLRKDHSEALKAYMAFCAFSCHFLQPHTLEKHLQDAANINVDTFVDKQMELNTRIDITADVEKIQAKTLVIGCHYDQMVPVHHSKQLFGAIDKACYVEIQSGHGVVFERPAEVFQYIDQFTMNSEKFVDGSVILAKAV